MINKKNLIKRKIILLPSLMILAVTALTGCSALNSYTGQSQVSDTTWGTGIGVTSGAIAGSLVGGKAGALIGAGVGGLAGAAIGHHLDAENAELRQQLVGTGVQVQKVGSSVQLMMASDVTFETNSAAINANFYPTLDSIAYVLKKYNDTNIVVSGFTDATGSAAYNQELSERRAQSVARYLASHSISEYRLFAEGFGKRNSVASNATETGRALNRRVVITLREMGN